MTTDTVKLADLNDAITNMLDEHDLSQVLQDSLHEDIAMLIWSALNASANYVADHDTYPKEVHFANGRVVALSANGAHLVVRRVVDSSYVVAPAGGEVEPVAWLSKLKLWFFRDLTDDQRKKLFSLHGLPVNKLTSLSYQQLAFNNLVATPTPNPAPSGEAVPVAWRYRLKNTAQNTGILARGECSEWKECTPEQAIYARQHGGVEGFPDYLVAEVRPLFAAPPSPQGVEAVVEECARIADRVRVTLEAQSRRGRLNQIEEYGASIGDSIAASIRALSPTESGRQG